MNLVLSSGQTMSYPVRFSGVSQAIATFRVRSADVAPLLPRDLKPLGLGYGMTQIYIFWLASSGSDLGPIVELQVGIAITDPFYRQPASYLFANPVSSLFAKEVSTELWGMHKTLASIEFERRGGNTCCTVSADGQLILVFDGPTLSGPAFETNALICCAAPGLSTTFRYIQHAETCADLESPSNVTITFGEHPLGLTLETLINGAAPNFYSYRDRGQVLIGPPLNRIL